MLDKEFHILDIFEMVDMLCTESNLISFLLYAQSIFWTIDVLQIQQIVLISYLFQIVF
jgi:hypothetical protein